MRDETLTQEEFQSLLKPIAQAVAGLDFGDADAVARFQEEFDYDGLAVGAVRTAAASLLDSDWLLPKENGPIRYGRVAKDLEGVSVDAVLMSTPGPEHRHPNGEVDLLIPLSGEPRFDGVEPGWVVYPPDSVHVPTVAGGEMLILYFLPGGAIEFL